jgi:hypothetical protein
MLGHIDNAVIFYLEPYASSACELVTERLQYFPDSCRPTKPEAEALLAGIMLDTRSFTVRAGARSFEAAAYLRRQGADPVAVKLLFSGTLEEYRRAFRGGGQRGTLPRLRDRNLKAYPTSLSSPRRLPTKYCRSKAPTPRLFCSRWTRNYDLRGSLGAMNVQISLRLWAAAGI